MSDFDYEGVRRVVYGSDEGATFIPICPNCRRFVKADKTMDFNHDGECDHDKPNATCKHCGRVSMPFEGYV